MAEPRRPFPSVTALALCAAALYAFYLVHGVLTPFVLAAAFAYVVNPVITYFEAKGLRRSSLVVAGYLGAILLGAAAYAGVKGMIVDQVQHLGENTPLYFAHIQKVAAAQEAKVALKLPLPPKEAQQLLDGLVGAGLGRLNSLPSEILLLLPFLIEALLVPFIAFFFLIDGPGGFDGLIQAMPSRYVEQALHLMSEIDASLGNYLRGILIVAVAITIASFIGLFALGIDNAFAIAVLSGVSSFVPYLGAIMGALVGGAMAFHQYGALSAALKVVLLFAGIRLLDEAVLQPVIAKHSVHLHPMVFLLALLVGGELFGFLGLVFAIPAACILKALIQVGWSWYASETGLAAPAAAACEAVPYT